MMNKISTIGRILCVSMVSFQFYALGFPAVIDPLYGNMSCQELERRKKTTGQPSELQGLDTVQQELALRRAKELDKLLRDKKCSDVK